MMLFAVPAQAALIFEQDWENSSNIDLSVTNMTPGFRCTNQCNSGFRVSTSNTHARSGNRGVKFQVQPGDLGGRVRCTMDIPSGTDYKGKAVLPYDSDRWFGFSVYIPTDSSHRTHGVMNLHQHNWGTSECKNSDSPPIGFNIAGPGNLSGNNYEWQLKYHGRTIARYSANSDLDKWTDWVFQVNMSFKGNGKVLIWKNGTPIREDYNFTLEGTNTPESCGHIYPKISNGMLQGNSWAPSTSYQDSHRWGDENSSFAEVDPSRGVSQTCDSTHLHYCYNSIDCSEAGGNWCGSSCQSGTCDNNPPVILDYTDLSSLPPDTTHATLTITTNENATCKHHYQNDETVTPPDIAYDAMKYTYPGAGGKTHTKYFDGSLSQIAQFYYAVKCRDTSGNTSDQTNILINVLKNTKIRADVNQDQSINTTDAMLTLRNSLGLNMDNTNWQDTETTGDVNCDNSSNLTDAMLILRYSLGLSMDGTGWCCGS